MTTAEARTILGSDFIIGGTANTLEDIFLLYQYGVDYIGLGPYRFTLTKENLSPILGLSGIGEIISTLNTFNKNGIPIIGIGGIQLEDVSRLMQTGIGGVAVSSAINKSLDKVAVIKRFMEMVNDFELAKV